MPTKTARERIQEIMFVTCPVDIQEPFFWKWNEHGLDMLEAFCNALLEEARQEMKEKCLACVPDDMFFGNEYERGQNDSRNEIRNSILSL